MSKQSCKAPKEVRHHRAPMQIVLGAHVEAPDPYINNTRLDATEKFCH